MKILGIDYGDLTIGIGIYDDSVDFIYPLKTIHRKRKNVLRKSINELCDIVLENNIKKIVIGLPLNADGTEGQRVVETNFFVEKLKNRIKDVDYIMVDERWTTIDAKELIAYKKYDKKEMKEKIDQVAACLILKKYKEDNNGKK